MNAQVAHADADTCVGGSTAPTTEVSKSNSDKAETVATSIEPQAPSDEGTSDANTGKSTTPATSDKAKSDNATSDKTKTDGKSETNDKSNASVDNKKNPTIETIDGIHQEKVTGEAPVLGTNILTSDEWKKYNLDPENLPAGTLAWKEAPDVSKAGKSEGTAIVTYYVSDPSSKDGAKAVKKTLEVRVDVDVKDGIKKADNQVRNRLTYIDKDSNEVVASYSWLSNNDESQKDSQVTPQVGEQKDKDQKPVNVNQAFDDNVATEIDQTVIGLGYKVLQDDRDAINSLWTFGSADQVVNVFVRKDSPNHKLMTWGEDAKEWDQSGQKTFKLPSYLGLSNDKYNNIDIDDPTNLIANVNDLPAGARVTWGIAPYYTDITVDNDPTIVISVPGQKDIILHLSDYDGSDSK